MHLHRGSRDEIWGIERRVAVLAGLVGAGFLLLLFHLFRLQVWQYDTYRKLADNNRIRLVEMEAPRGIITDRKGRVVADSIPVYVLAAVAEDMEKDRVGELRRLALLLGRDATEMADRFAEAKKRRFQPVTVIPGLTGEEVARFELEKDLFPGLSIQVVPRRWYPYGTVLAHVLGYVGEVSADALKAGKYPGAEAGDMVGQGGLELAYDATLRGKDGGRQVEVDARGREIAFLGIEEPLPGARMTLTIDLDVQLALEEALGGAGAGVVLDARSGEVLALASHPAFDPNEFAAGITRLRWRELAEDPRHPLQNRAVSGVYPPGSTFKPVTALAGLMAGTLTEEGAITCTGGLPFGKRVFRCWKGGGHGRISLHRSLVESCDVYYYLAGDRAGIDAIARWGGALGLGRRTGIDLPGEAAGLLPSQAWKRTARKEAWFPGETLSVAIGQGYVLVTPLQLASLYQTLATHGRALRPHLVLKAETVEGQLLFAASREERQVAEIPERSWEAVDSALLGVTEEPGGTGWWGRVKGVKVAGKTGTAQVVGLEQNAPRKRMEDMAELTRDHAWFAAFAPFGQPEVAAAVLVEHGGHGGSAAAPIVAKVLSRYWGTADRTQPAPADAATGD